MALSGPIRLAVVPALICVSLSACGSDSRFYVPPDDLPYALISGYRVDFTRNGAFVVSESGRHLFDGGLSYAMPGWREWGTQIRRSDRDDSFQLDDTRGRAMLCQGTLFDANRNPRFKFVQRTVALPDGLRLMYVVTPLAKRRIQEFGAALHVPAGEARGQRVGFWPGFLNQPFPAEQSTPGTLRELRARSCTLYASGLPLATMAMPRAANWRVIDDRVWRVNAFRIVCWDPQLSLALGRGEVATFAFDLMLGEAASHRLTLGLAHGCVDKYGRLTLHDGDRHGLGRKILEGGMAVANAGAQWLHDVTEPFHRTGMTEADGRPLAASGSALIEGSPVVYTVRHAKVGGQVAIEYQASCATEGALPSQLSVKFAVPAGFLASEPSVAAADGRAQESVLRLAYKQGYALALTAENPWAVQELMLDGTITDEAGAEERFDNRVRCYLLTTRARQVDGSTGHATIGISMLPLPPAKETMP